MENNIFKKYITYIKKNMEAVLLAATIGGIIIYESYKTKDKKIKPIVLQAKKERCKDKKYRQDPTINPVGFKYNVLNEADQSVNMTSENPSIRNDISCPYGDKLLNMNNRTIEDFKNNHFIPNVNRVTQNMTGTGVKNCGFLGFDCNRNADMGNANETANLPILNRLNYTGDSTYKHHKAVGPLFSPEEQQDRWVGQTPLIRPDMDRFKQNFRFKPDEKPCEPIRVGPGLDIGTNTVAEGGFNAGLNNRVMPTNIFNYETNHIQGQIAVGKHYVTEMPQSLPGHVQINAEEKYGVPQYKPKTYWSQEERPMVPTGSSHLQSITAYSEQSGALKTGLKRKNNLYGFGSIE